MTTLINTHDDISGDIMGGLCHLAEAATALSRLGRAFSEPVSVAPSVVSTDTTSDDVDQSMVRHCQGEGANVQQISDDDEDVRKKAASCTHGGRVSPSKRETFPQRLMAILEDSSLTDVITWLPNGESFVIIRPDVFTEEVLPKYLPPLDARSSTKYPSFTRKLNRWGFRQIQRGPDTGAFHHPLFRRGEEHLCLTMVCQRSRDRRSSKAANAAKAACNTESSSLPAPSRSLPPKKRLKVSCAGDEPGTATTCLSTSAPVRVVTQETEVSSAATVVSGASNHSCSRVEGAHGHSISVAAAAARSSRVAQGVSLLQMGAPLSSSRTAESLVSLISKHNGKLLEDALKMQEQNERLRIAKAVLYESFQRALGASSS